MNPRHAAALALMGWYLSLKKALLSSQPVAELYSALGRQPPIAT